jgi:hypothetical protein
MNKHPNSSKLQYKKKTILQKLEVNTFSKEEKKPILKELTHTCLE